jgi:hypothetical protein
LVMCSSQQIAAIHEAAALHAFCVARKDASCSPISNLMLIVLMSVLFIREVEQKSRKEMADAAKCGAQNDKEG